MRIQASVKGGRSGIVSILALLFLCIFASLGVALAVSTDLSLKKADNQQLALQAQMSAESGLDFCKHRLQELRLSPNISGDDLFNELVSSLQSELNGTGNLSGNTVSSTGGNIFIPSVTIGDNSSFTATLSMPDSTTVHLAVVGNYTTNSGQSFNRSLSMDFNAGSQGGALDYGMYSKGPIEMQNNLTYNGVNSPDEASIYTEASGTYNAVSIQNNGYVGGDIDVVDEFGTVFIGNNTTVEGSVNIGVPQSPMPQVDGSVFVDFATNVMDSSTPLQNAVLTNLRIPANMNPEFRNNITLLGVIYIESPNYVCFKNNVDVRGVIVTEDPDGGGGTNTLEFKNNLNVSGVENLPDTPEFAELRQLTGSAILAPGFDVEFKNNFTVNSGTIACESLILKNNVNATINGAIIIYGSDGLTFKNNATINIDRSGLDDLPAGISVSSPTILTANPDTYAEQY